MKNDEKSRIPTNPLTRTPHNPMTRMPQHPVTRYPESPITRIPANPYIRMGVGTNGFFERFTVFKNTESNWNVMGFTKNVEEDS